MASQVVEGTDQYTLTREQLMQKEDKKGRTREYQIILNYNGAWFPLSQGLSVCCHPPCTDEPRITLSAGVMVKVTRWKKHWLGRKCRWRSRRGPWGGWGAGFLGSVLWRRWSMRTDACWGRAGQEEGQVDENMIKGKQLGHIRIPKVSCKVYSCKIYCILFIQFINISARRQCNSNYYIFIEASLNSNWHPEEAYFWSVHHIVVGVGGVVRVVRAKLAT